MKSFLRLSMVTLVLLGFVGCRSRRSYQVHVATDASGLSELSTLVDPRDGLVLYRTGKKGVICFDSFRSKELHERFKMKNGKVVTAEYDTFEEFGKVSGYNVHSVDGMVLAEGTHVFREDYAASAGLYMTGQGTASGDDCW